MAYKRAILIVLDGCGVGAAPDAPDYGDTSENHPNTLGHLADAVGGLSLPTLQTLGLGNLTPLRGVPPADTPRAHYGKVRPHSKGKDSVTGHWEMMGIHTETPFPTYPNGFPPEVMEAFEARIGRGTLGNYPASGTEIIKQLGMEHLRTGKPIVYTSADSVFQIAAHEAVIPLDELYHMCEIARELLQPPHHVQRVIARPFVGDRPETFKRTENRRDFPLPPPHNLIDALAEHGIGVYGIGVVPELFVYRGFRHAERTQSNPEHYQALRRALESECACIFANFEDFDMLYGHRNDPQGFARALESFDGMLAELLTHLRPTDLLILTADHGNDPTTPSTDHSREYLPLLVYSPSQSVGRDLGVRHTLADIGATIGALWNLKPPNGEPL
ncbi:MAG: phosphopentomutase [Fimbriimonadales bacterium]|nr:MAG: phosphopentomutase [Fimbriimonadales bacterium]GIV10653.1 MAG: phosphopentomutase [Fimbriimonadales bacterium]